MRFLGHHRTVYSYSAPVYLEQQLIRLRPRSDPWQAVKEYAIEITPQPAQMTHGIDVWGNDVVWASFEGAHTSLTFATRFVVETVTDDPFNFWLPNVESHQLPPSYTGIQQAALAPYLATDSIGDSVRELAEEVKAEAGEGGLLAFPTKLAESIHSTCRYVVREVGDALAGAETLAAGEGSCRDLAVLYMEACRHVGVAARFASGYVAAPPALGQRELHAWAQVYIPGGGWRGYDPSQGLAVATGHVTLAASAMSAGAAPVSGSYRGEASSWLQTDVDMDVENWAQGDGSL
jgi:transglutaminase-like putative cysteine protease